MSKISNTASYPTVTPADGDLLIGTDVNDNDATKNDVNVQYLHTL